MKKIALLLAALIVFTCVALAGCESQTDIDEDSEETASADHNSTENVNSENNSSSSVDSDNSTSVPEEKSNFVFQLSWDDTYYILSDYLGGKEDIIIPSEHNGLPVKAIGDNAFDSSTITSVIIPDSIVSIGKEAFYHCYNLLEIKIPSSVREIGESAFWACGKYESGGTFNYSVYDNALYLGNDDNPYFALIRGKDDYIKNCVVHNDTKIIAHNAFTRCDDFSRITIPDGIEYIAPTAFSYTKLSGKDHKGGEYLGNENNPYLVLFGSAYGKWAENVIHEDTKIIMSFESIDKLTELNIPANVQYIEPNAFRWNDNLKKITVDPQNKTYHSTNNCVIETATKTLVFTCFNNIIPDDGSVTSIGSFAFTLSDATDVTIPDTVTTIQNNAFYNAEKLRNITMSDSVTAIGKEAFGLCKLDNIKLSNSITKINPYTFYGCTFESIDIPDSVTAICEGAFEKCHTSTVVLPNSVTFIGSRAFAESDITSITLPDSVTKIETGIFASCEKLTTVVLSNGLTEISEHAFSECKSLTSITIPGSVTTICEGGFYKCSSLSKITIPNSVTSIGSNAFYLCSSLTSIVIPETVTKIDSIAFNACKKLTDIYCKAEKAPSGWRNDWNKGCNATVHWGYKG